LGVKFGIMFANVGPYVDPDGAAAFAQSAEAAGFESVWAVEHVVVPAGYESAYPYSPTGKMPGPENSPIPDPLAWLMYVGAVTTKLRLGTGILILPQRNPAVLAKELATIDVLSKGRMELGIGVGWLREEFDALGVPYEKRGARTDEYVAALRALWADGPASYHGDFVDFADCYSEPKPFDGAVPIHVGGHTDAAARRAGRLGDGFFPGSPTHEELGRLFELARATAKEHGRDPDAIEMTTGGQGAVGDNALDEIKTLVDLGTDRVIVPAFIFWGDPDAVKRYGDDVIAKVS
jgi:probable F420-dependent oxidoreductase